MKPIPPLVDNPSQPDQVAFARRWERDRARAEHDLWRTQLGTYEGRAFVWMVLSRLPGRVDIHGEMPDVYRLLGRRSVWLELYLDIEQHPRLLLDMQQEGLARDKAAVREVTAQRALERTTREEDPTNDDR
jgi:hypothetical protein